MVVELIAGVTNVLLVCPAISVPPVATVYQRYCPATAPAAFSVTVPVPQLAPPVVVGAAGIVLMVATTIVLVLSQVPLLMDT